MAQDEEDSGRGPRRGPRAVGGNFRASRVFKVLCPDALVAAIIGHQGNTRKKIEDDTGTRLRISSRDEFYPGTRCRTLVATAGDTSQILSVLSIIVDMTVDCAAREAELSRKGREDSETFTGKVPGEYLIRIALPTLCTGALIGTRGERIQSIRDSSGAKLFVENDSYDDHQMVKVIGPPQTLNAAMPEICRVIEEEMDEERILNWGQISAFNAEPQRGKGQRKGGGKGQRREDRGHAVGSRGMDRSRSRDRGRDRGGGWRRDGPAGSYRKPRDEDHEVPNDAGDSGAFDDHADDGPVEEDEGLSFDGPLEALSHFAENFVPGGLEMAHAISCELPADRVENLIGRRGAFLRAVHKVTGAEVNFGEAPSDEFAYRTVSIQGPLLAVYAAHCMVMKQYHEEEYRKGRADDPGPVEEGDQIEALQSKLADLQRQLEMATRGGGGDHRSRKGGGGGSGGYRKGVGKVGGGPRR